MKKLLSNNLNIIIVLSIILLAITVFDSFTYQGLPYGFFTFLRWIITLCSGWIAYHIHSSTPQSPLIILFCIITILFNPFVIIAFDRDVWTIIDLLGLIIFSLYLFKHKDITYIEK